MSACLKPTCWQVLPKLQRNVNFLSLRNLASNELFLFNYEKKRIYYKDLEVQSPYNTYRNKGLPPGPICNPTVSSVDAAYNPADTEFLFFVTKGGGAHFFSKTYKEHLDFQKNNK